MNKTKKSLLLSIIFGIVFCISIVIINNRVTEQKNEKQLEVKEVVVDNTKEKEEIEEVKVEKKEEVNKEEAIETKVRNVPKNNTVSKSSDNVVYEEPRVDNEVVQNISTTNDSNLGTFKLTAYCNCSQCCGQWAGGATASGTMPTSNNTIAVDTSVIPFGTKVNINGTTYTAEDTGSAIKGNKIDIYFDSHEEAMNFGVQYADVYKESN